MNDIKGLSNKILEINLTTASFSTYIVPDKLTKLYLGGKGLALKLMYDRFVPGTEALAAGNIMVFHTGAYMGTGAPCSGRFAAVTKSPLTGIIASSSCGGPFGMALKTSGWDGLIIKGESPEPVWLEIDSSGVMFNKAGSLWGKDIEETHEILGQNCGGLMAIGPAGENLVNYANIVSGHRFFGRAGMGAVMGSKKVKAVTAKGKEFKVVTDNSELFRKIRTSFIADINRNRYTSVDLRKQGTASIVTPADSKMMLPINNFIDGTHPESRKISGEVFEKDHTDGFSTCKPCSILCGHKGNFNSRLLQVPEYETIGLLGTSLGIFDPVKIADWNETCRLLGLDTISAGSTLAWAMEAGEKDIFKSGLKFGESGNINETLLNIGYNRSIGMELGKGTKWLSEKYGGTDYAIHSKGLEAAAYDPRGSYGHGLGLATANRGACHLSSSIMSLQALMGFSFSHINVGNPYLVVYFEDLFSSINSLVTCQFTAYAVIGERPIAKYLPNLLIRIFMMLVPQIALQIILHNRYYRLYYAITGNRINQYKFRRAGKRIHLLERYMNTNEGVSKADDTLPERFLSETRSSDKKKRKVKLDGMLRRYYMYRGYSKNGVPRKRTLARWNIEAKGTYV